MQNSPLPILNVIFKKLKSNIVKADRKPSDAKEGPCGIKTYQHHFPQKGGRDDNPCGILSVSFDWLKNICNCKIEIQHYHAADLLIWWYQLTKKHMIKQLFQFLMPQ